jgi:membrane-associated protease RseP (regulator of RpoE activity)
VNFWRKTVPLLPPPATELAPLGQSIWPPTAPAKSSISRPWVHLLLFALTMFSMTAAGAMQQGVDPLSSIQALVHLVEGLPFAATLLFILTVHEFGHYFAARHWGVKASLPYFLPLPYISFLGTLGAVIKIHSPIPHKRALLDIGAAGPLAGFVIALIACFAGLAHSSIVSTDAFHVYPIELGSPLLFSGIAALVLPEIGPNQLVLLNPVAFAGWVGLFITAFNLFPIGQLDGGHIVYALFGSWHRHIARTAYAILLGMGVYGILSLIWELPQGWPGWLALAFFLAIFGKNHPAPYDNFTSLDPRRRLVGYLCLLIFVVCFAPVPFATS